jgi:hypothetical protein
MAATKQLIQTVTVGSGGAASIDFTSIPQNFTDLQVVLSGRAANAGTGNATISFNGSSSNFSWRLLYGNGSSTASGNGTSNLIGAISTSSSTSNTFSSCQVYIPNYVGSTNKSFSTDSVFENNSTTAFQDIWANLWSQTAAITSISLGTNAGNFVEYSTASLYGITKGDGGATVS